MKITSYIPNKYRSLIGLIILIVIVTLVFLLFSDSYYHYFNLLDRNSTRAGESSNNIQAFHAIVVIILTIFMICVEWVQLYGMNEIAKADFLLRIDERYGSESIIKARQIIHRLYLESKINGSICKEKRDEILSNKIKELYEDKKHHKDFIHLLNFLDFPETISYFSNQQHVSTKEINELLGGSLEYFHKIFIPLRDHLRNQYKDNPSNSTYYCELDKLILNIQNKTKK